ncbi:MAG: dihydroxyacetone kinase [Glaciihabitans sp.]|nr:dihydroxyacetone kinase [Glaciihabitans sp.]
MANAQYAQLRDWIDRWEAHLIEQRTYLTELDSAIGDGDHGTNMVRGLAAASARADAEVPEHVDDLFKAVGMAIVRSVGGASGPLYGTFFLRFGATAGHVRELDGADLAEALGAGASGVAQRGKPELGDKTMFDAMSPAVGAFAAAIARGEAPSTAANSASVAAHAGREATAELVARKGRASYLGERSVGHIDPGATSTALLFQSLAEALA